MKVLEFDRLDAFLELEIDGKEIKEVSEIPLIDAIPLDKVKDVIQKMDDLASHKVRPISFDQAVAIDMCIDIVKKLIESEG